MQFSGEVWYWRGPAPFYFVTVPEELSRDIGAVANEVTYGWGMIPAVVTVGATTWETALWPKDGRYIVPLKVAVRRAEDIDDGSVVAVELSVVSGRR